MLGRELTNPNCNPTYDLASGGCPLLIKQNKMEPITGQDVLKIRKTTIVKPYKKDAKEGFKGKEYRIYAFGDKAFAVHTEDDFIKDFDAGNVKEVILTEDTEGISFVNHISWTKAMMQKASEVKFESINEKNYKVTTAESLEETIF